MAEYKGKYFILSGADPFWDEYNVKTVTAHNQPVYVECESIFHNDGKLNYSVEGFEKNLNENKIVPNINGNHIQHLINKEYIGGFTIEHEFDIVTSRTPDEALFQEDL